VHWIEIAMSYPSGSQMGRLKYRVDKGLPLAPHQRRCVPWLDTGLSARAVNAFINAGYKTPEDALAVNLAEFIHEPNVGAYTIKELEQWLRKRGVPADAVLQKEVASLRAKAARLGFCLVPIDPGEFVGEDV
jgi:hypothetical protein